MQRQTESLKIPWELGILVGALLLGQLGRIPPGEGGALLMLDLVLVFLVVRGMLTMNMRAVRQLRFSGGSVWVLAAFVVVLGMSLVLNDLQIGTGELIRNSFYTIRVVLFLLFAGLLPTLVPAFSWEMVVRFIRILTIGWVFLGFIQLWVLPDLAVLSALGWDPHVGRLVSTVLDPNFLGGSFAVLMAVHGASFVLARKNGQDSQQRAAAMYIMLLAVGTLLTFSRSGYIAVVAVLGILGLTYLRRLTLGALIIMIPLALAVPRVRERVGGLFSFDATSQQRVDSWVRGFKVAEYFPITGNGYGNYRVAQELAGTLPPGSTGHSGAATDSTFFNFFIGAGVVGLALAIAAYLRVILAARRRGVIGFSVIALLTALAVHSIIVNSLVNPFVVLPLLVVIVGMLRESPERHG
jgi:hypothetical protein